MLVSLEGWDIQYALRFGFPSTNNETEYEALVTGLTIAKEMGVQHLKAHSDSQLVVGHVIDDYEAREESMKQYLQRVKELTSAFHHLNIQQVPRDENMQADTLSKLVTFIPNDLYAQVFFKVLEEPSISRPKLVLQIDAEPCWMDPLVQYLTDGSLPEDRAEARRLWNRATRFLL